MTRKALVWIVLMCVAVGIFSVAPNVSAEEEEFVATVIDTADSETNVLDIYLYHRWCIIPGYPKCTKYESRSKKSMLVEKGESRLTIPFGNILEMEFEWAETEEDSIVTITLLDGKKIKGTPLDSEYRFKGKTDYGDFELSMTKTKKVIFFHAITPLPTTPMPVTTTPTPTLTPTLSPTATPALVPSPTQTLTPAASPDQIPTPIPRPAGFEVLFVLVAVLAVSLLIIKRRIK